MKILVGYDGTSSAKDALKLAKSHAKAFNAAVEVVTSMQKATESERKEIEQAERGLAYAKSVFDEHNIDEIIVGVNRRSKVGKLLLGSTAQYVILQSQCPVVTVK
jgi:nucleotide-binding universal stress UspA family protein